MVRVPGEDFPLWGVPFFNQEFLTGSQRKFDFTDYHSVLSLHHYHIFVIPVGMFSGISTYRICPIGDLAAISAVKDVTLDAFCVLLMSGNFVRRMLHKFRKVVHY